MPNRLLHLLVATYVFLLTGFAGAAFGQPEVMAWGNLTGVRVDGHLIEVNTGLCVAQPEWAGVTRTDKERQQVVYKRSGPSVTVTARMRPKRELRDPQGRDWALAATEVVEDAGPGAARIDVEFASQEEANIAGAFLCLDLPATVFSAGKAQLIEPAAPGAAEIPLTPGAAEQNEYLRATARGVRLVSARRQIEVMFAEPGEIVIRDDRREGSYNLQVYLTVLAGKAAAGQVAKKSFTLKATEEIDKSPVELTLDASRPGQLFDGLGGNFRIQNPKTDPPVIQHNLETLRVAWGRVEMPWRLWHTEEGTDPLALARAGKANPRVEQAMEMSRKLALRGMPIIVSAWAPPAWAVLGDTRMRMQPGDDGPRGNPLNPEKMARICDSLTSYLVFLKEKYGVEAAFFSFNESDLGIAIRQTGKEHAELIKSLGARLAAAGLATKMLLGDTSDARPVGFIKAAMGDPEAVKYIGAVSFHSWRGCTDEILAQWRDAARALNVPLLVGEGSTDAAAHRYPQIFLEPTFAMYEINLYTRILAISQPRSILQWQLTADYSLLAGGGIYGDTGPLRPTQRYWNLKQLASTPARSFALPIQCAKPGIACAAFGNIAEGVYTMHVVNGGAARPATIAGLPAGLKQLRVWVTDAQRGMQELERVSVVDGKATLQLGATSFTTLINVP